MWCMNKKQAYVTYEGMEKLLTEQREQFQRYIGMVAEEYQERLKGATELIPVMYEDITIMKQDIKNIYVILGTKISRDMVKKEALKPGY